MASGDTLALFTAMDGVPPATAYATLDTLTGASTPVEAYPFLAFNIPSGAVEYMDFHGVMPNHYAGGGVTLTFIWGASVTTNKGAWAAAFRLIDDDVEDLDTTAHTYDYNQTADIDPPSAAGEVAYDTLAFTNGADMDSVVANKQFTLRVKRPAPSGTEIAADMRLHSIIVKET